MTKSIPASNIVSVIPGVVGAGGTGLDTIGLALTANTRIPIGSILPFATQAAVAAYFGPNSAEATLAGNYFLGFDNSSQKPGSLLMTQYPLSAVAAYLRGGNVSALTLTQLQAINGTLTVTVDGVSHTAASLTLASATSFSAAAGLITTALAASDAAITAAIAPSSASFTGVLAAGVLTVSALTGLVVPGSTLTGVGVTANTLITSQLTGSAGGVGTYQTNQNQTLASVSMTSANAAIGVMTVSAVASGTLSIGDTVTGVGVTAGTSIVGELTGAGGTGTYLVTPSQTVSSESMTVGGVVVTYDSVSGAFVVTSGLSGAGSAITYATGTTADPLGLTQATGAVLSQGAAAATPAAFMGAVVSQTQDWVDFWTVFEPVTADKVAFAGWTNSQANRYAYLMWDTGTAPTIVPDTTSAGALIQAANDSGTVLIYAPLNGAMMAAFLSGSIASVDYDLTNGRATQAFRSQQGLVADVTDQITYTNLEANGYNAYCAFGTANDQFVFFYDGSITGEFNFIDSYVNEIWLNNALQLALMSLLTAVLSVPYNAAGNALIAAACQDPINAAVNAGVIRSGVVLSAAQVAEVNNAAGKDIATTLQSRGWYLQIGVATAQVRAQRGSPPMTFWYTDGQSVQKINLSSLAVL